MSITTEGSTSNATTPKLDWGVALGLAMEAIATKSAERKSEIREFFNEHGFTETEINNKFRELGFTQ